LKEPQITVDNDSSENTTIIRIKAADNFGLLHTIIQHLNKHALNIRSAHLSTRIDQAEDIFYVTDARGEKVTDPDTLTRLTADIALGLQG
jgi:[protein-PII] uridylyltransferase